MLEQTEHDVAVFLTRMEICRISSRDSKRSGTDEFCETNGMGRSLIYVVIYYMIIN